MDSFQHWRAMADMFHLAGTPHGGKNECIQIVDVPAFPHISLLPASALKRFEFGIPLTQCCEIKMTEYNFKERV